MRLCIYKKELKMTKKKLVRAFQGSDQRSAWLSGRCVSIKFNQPIQLDLVEWINQKEKQNG